MLRSSFVCLILALSLAPRIASAQPATAPAGAQAFSITRSDPSLDELIAPDAQVRTVAAGFGFIDGPVWMAGRDGSEGYLLASSIIDNVIYKVTPAGKVSVFLDRAGYGGEDLANVGKLAQIGRAHVLLMGPGCTGVDRQGRLIWCAGQDLAIKRLEKDGTRTVLAAGFEGKHFNGPNDVAIAADGAIYFTDSDVGLRGGIHSPKVQMPDSVWRWKDGKVTLAVSREQLGAEPNGIALSPDDKYLYLSAGTLSPDPKVMRYPVKADGSLGPGELFTHGRGIGDGMKTDRLGNLYSTEPVPGSVRITSPAGRLLGLLHMPTPGDAEPRKTTCASSLAFGGDDAKTLYITACEYIYAIQLRAPGILQGPANPPRSLR
jgi:gluconolactonase